jgi:peptide chain release factor 2
VKEFEMRMAEADFWDRADEAQKVISELNGLRAWTVPYQELNRKFLEIAEFLALEDPKLNEELGRDLDEVDRALGDLEVRKMLSGELDDKDCYLEINAGAGGTESCDWASMLARMYQRWASKKRWKVEIIDRQEGDVAGIKSIVFRFTGPFAYGYSKSERGVHRLVRISPFDANAKRHTSFASVDVTPIVEDVQVEIRPEDIRVDTYRSSGAGGQHVNKTDSAVRMTHIPTGIVVSCQGERSQIQNRETCMKMLSAKLYEREREAQAQKLSGFAIEKKEIGWSSQIRNYVFQPYTLVKDVRTEVQSGNVQAVMDGEIDEFVLAYLKRFSP